MTRLLPLFALALAVVSVLAACGEQGYSRTRSYSARVGPDGSAADAVANNGSISSSYEKQRQKVNGAAY